MPALNIIAIHEKSENSGGESSLLSRIRPKRLKAIIRHSTRNTSAAMTKSHAKLSSTQGRAAFEVLSKECLPRAAHSTTPMTPSAPIVTTTRSGEESDPGSAADSGSAGPEGGWPGGTWALSVLIANHYGRVYGDMGDLPRRGRGRGPGSEGHGPRAAAGAGSRVARAVGRRVPGRPGGRAGGLGR